MSVYDVGWVPIYDVVAADKTKYNHKEHHNFHTKNKVIGKSDNSQYSNIQVSIMGDTTNV